MKTRTSTVKISGRRFRRLSVHRARNSLEWFFFITMARRKGAMNMMVSTPVMALAYQLSAPPDNRRRKKGSAMVNIGAMTAVERML